MQIKVIRAFRHDGKVFEAGKSAALPDQLARQLISDGKAAKVDAKPEPEKKDEKSTDTKDTK